MKIRIKGNAVRFRLSKPEVAKLAAEGYLEERTEFAQETFIYAIQQTQEEAMSADFYQYTINLFVPQTTLQRWANGDQVGIEKHNALPNGNSLYLLLEKDFKCIEAGVTEDQSDYFENPHKTC